MSIVKDLPKEQMNQQVRSFLKKNTKNRNVLCLFFVFLSLVGMISWFHYRVKKIESKQKELQKFTKAPYYKIAFTQQFGGLIAPPQLAGITFGNASGIVLDAFSVNIRNVYAPYNPGIFKTSNGYDLFFRYDLFNPKLKYASFEANIGVVSVDHQFKQKSEEFKQIDLKTNYGEDPRILSIKDQLYLFYNRMDENNPRCRFMYMASLNPRTYEVNYNTPLDMNLQWVEKNWSPFEYVDPDHKYHLLLEYQINPRKVLEVTDPQANEMRNIPVPSSIAYLDLAWTSKWGEIRGGTPPVRVGNEYLGFFHSWFLDAYKCAWYVMGAYTFSAEPPFNLTGISPHPILFEGIYETPLLNTASVTKRVIFPSGFVVEKKNDRETIYLACGENDSGIKIVVLDKENLLNSLTRFD